MRRAPDGSEAMFFLFSGRLGCLKSLLISAVITLILLALYGFIHLPRGGW